MRAALAAFVCLVSAGLPLFGAEPLFPAPLHLTREVQDPISGKTVVVQEYGYGNRLVSVRGSRTSIADFEKSELIEIDREAGTYSVTRFDAVAKASRATAAPQSAAAATAPRRPLRAAGSRISRAGRTAEVFEGDLETPAGRSTIEVAVDRSVVVSRAALEVLSGAAYPAVRTPEHDVVFAAAAPGRLNATLEATGSRAEASGYGLPVEHVVRHHVDGESIEFRTAVTRVGSEMPPADVVSIPAGARLIESRIVAIGRELDRLDHPALIP